MDISQNFFTKRVVKPWKRLHREEIESPSLEIFKIYIYVVLMDVFQWQTWQCWDGLDGLKSIFLT